MCPTNLDELSVESVDIDSLRPDPANPRHIAEDQLEALTKSLVLYGFVQPVVARSEDKMVIGGHQRLVAARRLGYKTVPVVFLDISLEQARLLNLSLNKVSGDWDRELLAQFVDGQMGAQPPVLCRRGGLRLHVFQRMAAGLPHPGGGGRPLVGHGGLGQRPLRPRAGRLPAPVRTDLVRLAGGCNTPLVAATATRGTSGASKDHRPQTRTRP